MHQCAVLGCKRVIDVAVAILGSESVPCDPTIKKKAKGGHANGYERIEVSKTFVSKPTLLATIK